jgi:aromatic-L-amino-acid decarboxylase
VRDDPPPETGEPMEAIFADFERTHRAGHDALAASALLRLFPGQCRARLGCRRISRQRHGGPVHALADLAGGHRARDPGARLAAAGDRPAGRVCRRHPGLGLDRDARRRAGHARTCASTGRATARVWPGKRRAGLCSDQVHTSIDRAIWVSGIGADNLVRIPTSRGRCAAWITAALDAAIRCRQGRRADLPAGIIACVGGTSVGATDDIEAVCAVAKKHGLYLHVDAAWAGSAMICPEFRHFWAGRRACRFHRLQPAQMARRTVRLLRPVSSAIRMIWCARWPSSRNT